jgi:hypothetical protein
LAGIYIFIEKHLRILSRQQQFFLFGLPHFGAPTEKAPGRGHFCPRGFAPAGDKIADRWAALYIYPQDRVRNMVHHHKARVLILPETTWNKAAIFLPIFI